jgi:hypothetical protein
LVVKAAEQGDAVAQEVVSQGGFDLGALAGLVIERIRAMEAPLDSVFDVPSVAIAGSILEQAAAVRNAMIAELRRRYPAIQVVDKPADPPAGALWAARQGGRPATAAHGSTR